MQFEPGELTAHGANVSRLAANCVSGSHFTEIGCCSPAAGVPPLLEPYQAFPAASDVNAVTFPDEFFAGGRDISVIQVDELTHYGSAPPSFEDFTSWRGGGSWAGQKPLQGGGFVALDAAVGTR
ncbi:hypothetical protein [Posidoniimonas polymericola]|uniref:hypothetical protein n=1 Tax=Posidoniimonas polymericola TaxID=2528002 RepID=UPI0011B6C99A|nr:hypothetical protein [Posidoniimonas polymericola]